MDYGLWTTDYRLPTTDYRLNPINFPLDINNKTVGCDWSDNHVLRADSMAARVEMAVPEGT